MSKALICAAVLTVGISLSSFAADAAKPVAKKAQTECPVMGGAVDKKLYVDYKGQRVYFCCQGCIAAFKKDPEKYLKIMAQQGVKPEKAPTAKKK